MRVADESGEKKETSVMELLELVFVCSGFASSGCEIYDYIMLKQELFTVEYLHHHLHHRKENYWKCHVYFRKPIIVFLISLSSILENNFCLKSAYICAKK